MKIDVKSSPDDDRMAENLVGHRNFVLFTKKKLIE